jgi:hypothetical protein
LDPGDDVCCDSVVVSGEVAAFWIAAGEVEEVDSCEDHEEAGDEGEDVDCIGGVEAAVEDEGCAEGCCCECYVV